MHLIARILLLIALSLTVVPGRRPIAKAQHPEPPSNPPQPIPIPLTLPKCAQPAQKKTLQSLNCSPHDPKCMCSKKEWLPLLLGAITHVCGSKDREATKQFGAAYCGLDPKTVLPAVPTVTTLPGQPTVEYTCSPLDREAVSTTTIHETVHSTVNAGTRTSTLGKTTRTKVTGTPTGKTSSGSHKGMIGAGSRLESGVRAMAAVGAVVAMGWTFAEF